MRPPESSSKTGIGSLVANERDDWRRALVYMMKVSNAGLGTWSRKPDALV